MTKQELENYEPKGQLEGFPKEIIARMLECQEEQGNKRDISIFEEDKFSFLAVGGFDWNKTKEKEDFWNEVITGKDFDLFFKQYPKQDKSINIVRVENKENNSTPNFTYAENSCDIVIDTEDAQKFKVGDEVYDIIIGEVGIVKEVNINDISAFQIEVVFENHGTLLYPHEDKYLSRRLLHYRDDYNYDIIDFNNLPKRQEPKRWRAKKNGVYNYVGFDNKDGFYSDDTKDYYTPFDNNNYNSGNYFSTEVEAEIIAQKLNSYFKQLIQEEHEHERI